HYSLSCRHRPKRLCQFHKDHSLDRYLTHMECITARSDLARDCWRSSTGQHVQIEPNVTAPRTREVDMSIMNRRAPHTLALARLLMVRTCLCWALPSSGQQATELRADSSVPCSLQIVHHIELWPGSGLSQARLDATKSLVSQAITDAIATSALASIDCCPHI